MPSLKSLAGRALRRTQSLVLFRRIGRMTAGSIVIREATDADKLDVQRWFNPHGDPVQTLQRNPSVTDWVAYWHGQVVGFVQLVRHPPEHAPYIGHWLFSLAVKSRWQGLGAGESLSREVIARSAAEGSSTLDLVVFNDNTRAIRLYRKLGFQMILIPELEAQLEKERTPSGRRRVVMRKRLEGGA
ncbi:MAG: GNAT family N-acetyltransferase [bacterium]